MGREATQTILPMGILCSASLHRAHPPVAGCGGSSCGPAKPEAPGHRCATRAVRGLLLRDAVVLFGAANCSLKLSFLASPYATIPLHRASGLVQRLGRKLRRAKRADSFTPTLDGLPPFPCCGSSYERPPNPTKGLVFRPTEGTFLSIQFVCAEQHLEARDKVLQIVPPIFHLVS